MADSHIGALPQIPQLDDESLMVAEQQGQAMKVTGAQFKEFGRQAVVTQVQGLVDQAQAAASEAVSAASAVTDMTVEAHASPEATVSKSMKDGKVNLSFGLPRGEKGEPGPEGKEGPRGPRGEPGNGLTIIGHYDTEEELRAAVPSPSPGDAYDVGTAIPYDTYIFDGVSNDWRNHGPLSGGGGVIPDNVVTTPGGAELEFSSGDGPHTVTFDFEEEPPLTAEDIAYSDTQTVKEVIDGLFTSVSDGKALIASAITDKGVPTAQDAAFADMASNIKEITTGSDTGDATATSFDILSPKTAYTAAGKVEGNIPTLAAKTYTPGTAAQTISAGQYLGGTQTIQGDPNLTSSNIKKGASIFGVAGALETSFQAILTVKADTGAVVTATHTDGTKVEALSTTGQVVLELPIEGTWKVTAVRGIAQYNTVTIEVTSHYSATLTAEIHIKYFGVGTSLNKAKYNPAAITGVNYALFGGGGGSYATWASAYSSIDAYDEYLTHSNVKNYLTEARTRLGAATTGNYALFAGGHGSNETAYATVEAYDESLTRSLPEELCVNRYNLGSASVGNYALFGGGIYASSGTTYVDAYDTSLTHSRPTPFLSKEEWPSAVANSAYAIFYGENSITAYDKNLVRTALAKDSTVSNPAVRAGNYALFLGRYSDEIIAFDLFLTKTKIEGLGIGQTLYPYSGDFSAATVNDLAVIGGNNSTLFMYDPFLVKTTANIFQSPRPYLAATAIGNYVIFGGGEIRSNATERVDIYQYV